MRSLQQEEKNQENKGKESANSFSQTRAVGVVKLAAGHMIIVMRSAAAGIGCPDHMSPACPRPKEEEKGESSPQKPRVQKVEGEDSSSTSSRLKDEDTMSEVSAMKELLEQDNTMLRSLTTTSTSTSSSSTGTTSEPKEAVMSRLQQQLDQLKLKVFKVSQIKAGGHPVLSILVLHIHFVLDVSANLMETTRPWP